MADTKIYAGKTGIQQLWRRVRDEIGKFETFQEAPASGDGTPDVAPADRKTNIIYLVYDHNASAPDLYKEWIWTVPDQGNPKWLCIGDTSMDLSGYALKSEMSVVQGTGVDADRTTITLKSGTSATVINAHQDISGKADRVTNGTENHFASLTSTGNLADSGYSSGSFKAKASQSRTFTNDSATKTVDTVTEDVDGDISVTFKEIQTATTSVAGLVQLEDSYSSTSTAKAATSNSVKAAYDLAAGKYSLPSGGIPSTDMTSAVQASLGKADSAIQHVCAGQEELVPVSQTVTIPYATENTGGLITDNMAVKLSGIEANAEVNVQSDWNVSDNTSDAFIKNKPALATVATSGSYADLSNTPTIPIVPESTMVIIDSTTYLRTYDGHSVYAARTDCDKDGNDITLGIDGTTNPVTDNSGEPVQDSYGNPLADAESDARVVSIGELPIWADRAEKDASGNDIEATYATKQELQDALGDLETILASI